MSQVNSAYPVVLNLTSDPERFAPDVAVVEYELKRLMDKNLIILKCDETGLHIGPRWSTKDPDDAHNDEALWQQFRDYAQKRLTELKYVLLLERWPENSRLYEGVTVIQEPLGVYLADFSVTSFDKFIASLGLSSAALQQIRSACIANQQSKCTQDPVPVVVLLMDAIVDQSSNQSWCDLNDRDGHSWLTRKVFHHEVGHHIFSFEEEDLKEYNKDDQIKKRAEAGANWYAWMIGSLHERSILKRFSDVQAEPYRAYRDMINWASSGPLSLGVVYGSYALIGVSAMLNRLSGLTRNDLNDLTEIFHCVEKMPDWLRKIYENDSHFEAVKATTFAKRAAIDALK